MSFKSVRDKLRDNFERLCQYGRMYEVDVDKDLLYDMYLDSFPSGTNEIFRERREHDCSECRGFIRELGRVVAIDANYGVHSIWRFVSEDETYQGVFDALADYIESRPITDVYVAERRTVGIESNKEMLDDGKVMTWRHFYANIPASFLKDRHAESVASEKNVYRTTAQVFKRSLNELSADAVDTVLELIADGSLYRGETNKEALLLFKKCLGEYATIPANKRGAYYWKKSMEVGDVVARIRNHAIGTLLVNISDGMELEAAVSAYERIVAPENYKRPKAVFTKRMLEDAKKTITSLGYGDSLRRRLATLDDISANNVLFANLDAAHRIKDGDDLFAEMEKSVGTVNPKKFARAEEISIDKFINDVLPTAQSVSALVTNDMARRFVSLVAPVNQDAPTMFKWNNAFSWAYTGNIADSSLKEAVKKAGGKVDGVLRFSIMWNDGDEYDGSDEDAHCIEPNGYEIYYAAKESRTSGGELDVDIINPKSNVPAVENITYPSLDKLRNGKYQFFVKCFTKGRGCNGFRAEIEFDGKKYNYECLRPLKEKERVEVATVTYDRNKGFSIKHSLAPIGDSIVSVSKWGVNTNNFVPVTAITYSPNYWGENGTGNKHVFFFLDGCKNDEEPNAWYNEYLKEELVKNHKRVMEALGARAHVEYADDQLSGIGFSTTQRAELVVKVIGATERVLKIKF